jgi:hypothetical protein
MDALQAAILGAKFKHLAGWTAGRQRNAALYRKFFLEASLASDDPAKCSGMPVILPKETGWGRHIYHLYQTRVNSLATSLNTKDTKYTKVFSSFIIQPSSFLLRLNRHNDNFCCFTVDRDRRIRADKRANSTPRATVLERVRGVVALVSQV